jgi:hypothetical protein
MNGKGVGPGGISTGRRDLTQNNVKTNDTREVFVKHADNFSDRPDVFFFKTMLNGKGEYTALLYNSVTNIGLFL